MLRKFQLMRPYSVARLKSQVNNFFFLVSQTQTSGTATTTGSPVTTTSDSSSTRGISVADAESILGWYKV